ncbi:hypothetical protein D3C71_1316280 [compost metagenome]
MDHLVAGACPAGLDGTPDLGNLRNRQHTMPRLGRSPNIPGPQTHHVGHVDRAAANMPVKAGLQPCDHRTGYPRCPLADGIEIAQPHVHGYLVEWPVRQTVLDRREGVAIVLLSTFTALPHHILLEPFVEQGGGRGLFAGFDILLGASLEFSSFDPGIPKRHSWVTTDSRPDLFPVLHMAHLEGDQPFW